MLNKVAETGTRIKEALRPEGAADAAEARLKEIKAFSAYMASLADANPPEGIEACHLPGCNSHLHGRPGGFHPFLKANGALLALKSGGLAPGEGLWQLMSGPLDFLWAYACQETACHLQDLWVKEVLTQVQGITDPTQISAILGGPQGIGSRFMQGPAAPFLNRSLSGYSPKEVMGRKVAFEAGFLSFSARAGKPVQSTSSSPSPAFPRMRMRMRRSSPCHAPRDSCGNDGHDRKPELPRAQDGQLFASDAGPPCSPSRWQHDADEAVRGQPRLLEVRASSRRASTPSCRAISPARLRA